MKNILLDIDGVLANFYKGFASYLNNTYNIGLDENVGPMSYNFDEWNDKAKYIDFKEASNNWVADSGFLKLEPYDGVERFVKNISELGNIIITTARIGEFDQKFNTDLVNKIQQDTNDWISKYIGIKLPIVFDHKKVEYCLNNNINIMIEDKLTTALNGAKENINTVLIDRNWNKSPPRYKVYRVFSYDEAESMVRKLINE